MTALASRLAGCEGGVVVDLSEVTFCDAIVAGSLADVLGLAPVTVQGPTRLAREFLALYSGDRGHRTVPDTTSQDCQ